MIEAENLRHERSMPGNVARWMGILLAPLSWAVQLQTLWLTSEYGCLDGNFIWNHVVAAAALICAVVGGMIAWQGLPKGPYDPSKQKATRTGRNRFMGYLGVALSIEFSVLIIALWLPTVIGVPCHK